MKKSNKDYLYSTIFKLFLSKHYELVTIKDIEEATGMTRGAVFYYSQNKQSLFCDIVDAYFFKAQDLEDKFKALQNYTTENRSLLDFIHDYVKAVDCRMQRMQDILKMERADVSRAYLSFVLQAQNYYPSFNEKMTAVFDAELAMWESALKSAQERGEINDRLDAKSYARFFRYFYVGLCYQTSMNMGINMAELEMYFMSMYMLIKK